MVTLLFPIPFRPHKRVRGEQARDRLSKHLKFFSSIFRSMKALPDECINSLKAFPDAGGVAGGVGIDLSNSRSSFISDVNRLTTSP